MVDDEGGGTIRKARTDLFIQRGKGAIRKSDNRKTRVMVFGHEYTIIKVRVIFKEASFKRQAY